MRTLYIYYSGRWNFETLQYDWEAIAFHKFGTHDAYFMFLFECKEEWLPKTKEEFHKAVKHFGKKIPESTAWFGYVPF